MYPKQHAILGLIFATILFLFFPEIGFLGFSLIVFSSVLIDVDHYVNHVLNKKDWNLKNAFRWHVFKGKKLLSLLRAERNNYYTGFFFLHGLEVLILFFILSFFFKPFLFIFIGFSFHLILDIIYQTTFSDRIDRVSLIYDFFKFKKLNLLNE